MPVYEAGVIAQRASPSGGSVVRVWRVTRTLNHPRKETMFLITPKGMTCWKCDGLCWLVDAERPGYTLYKPCPICGGNGHIR